MRHYPTRSILAAAVALVSSCATPQHDPNCPDPESAPALPSIGAAPPNVPPTRVQPRPANVAEMQQALEDAYPPELRDAGVGGTVSVWTMVSPSGRVVDVQLQESSGYVLMDQAALRVARQFRFEPATEDGCPVTVWVAFPITFSASGQAAVAPAV